MITLLRKTPYLKKKNNFLSMLLYPIVRKPCIPMRAAPSPHAKVVSQAIFGERVDLGQTDGEWVFIHRPRIP